MLCLYQERGLNFNEVFVVHLTVRREALFDGLFCLFNAPHGMKSWGAFLHLFVQMTPTFHNLGGLSMPILPFTAHGDTLPLVKVDRAYKGKGEARQEIGSKVTALLLFDNCAHAPITIAGLDMSKLPSPEVVSARNQKMQFLLARFRDLEINFRGGDYGSVVYSGTASGVEFLNLNPPTSPAK